MQEASSPEEEVELAFAQFKRLVWLHQTNPEAEIRVRHLEDIVFFLGNNHGRNRHNSRAYRTAQRLAAAGDGRRGRMPLHKEWHFYRFGAKGQDTDNGPEKFSKRGLRLDLSLSMGRIHAPWIPATIRRISA